MVQWIMANYVELLQILAAVVVVGEMITRLTPTQTDDGFVHRVGSALDSLFDLLKIPNRRVKSDDIEPY